MINVEDVFGKYISGEEFSNSKGFVIKNKFNDKRRVDLIRDYCRAKKIIHVGCVDHLPLINDKIQKNIWLHKIITDVSEKCVGVDTNLEGIAHLKNTLGYKNVVCANIKKDEIQEVSNENWDYLVLGEIIEHVNDPVDFINSIVRKYQNKVQQIIITAPNILVKNRFNKMIKSKAEEINTDHRFWFTPFTLAKIMSLAGLRDIYLDFADRSQLTRFELIVRKFRSMFGQKNVSFPFYYFNSIIGVASLK